MMSGTGPAPKLPDERRNKTPPSRGEWVDLEPLAQPVLVELEGNFSERARQIWEAWRRDPVTTQWGPADVDYALETIDLRERCWPSKASEIRLRLDALGLTPKGKRDLRWRVLSVKEEPKREPARRAAKRRAHLTAVE